MAYEYEALIGGSWVGGEERIEVLNPATGERIGSVPSLGPEVAGDVYETAARGAGIWRRTSPLKRMEILFGAARIMRGRLDELARIIVQENGKTLAEARGEVTKSAEFLEYYAGMGRDQLGYLIADARPDTSARAVYEPIGVVLAITPWNDALLTPCRKLAPAFIAGNAVVIKPASDTPLIAIELAKALVEAGMPSEVIQVVTGRGGTVVDALLADSRVAGVSFTGSTEVGLRIQRSLAGSNVRVQTEMGGKNASVVLADADLVLAADTVVAAAFGGAGQRCTATSRVIVESSVREEFLAELNRRVGALVVGNGLSEGVQVGALINPGHRDRVMEAIEDARRAGGEVLVGGDAPGGELAAGCFVRPTVVANLAEDSSAWREEIFGPVIAVRECADLDDALRQVNDSSYGLSAAVFTRSLAAAERFIAEADTGQVSVNLPTSGWDIHHPFGGFKFSGSGYKEQGVEALGFYRRVKTAAVRAV
ncbi:aldehyde dehydrogenase family protein [Leucobacter ruminantium]|uniref:Aldehyde dehydrogenase n=1 Tax=Leucobacter ruminantium TaxID=1289170 RepID=A0A939RWJ0_9MICO|nr:aldehyde dehydrogenase family protein [Leucobacter ruminantium]MBO1805087.1 aldehyde dehydrogenase [Leucobacter ruminantium]